MKNTIISLLGILLFTLSSCNETIKPKNHGDSKIPSKDTTEYQTFEGENSVVLDTPSYKYFSVAVEKAYLHNSPDSISRSQDFLAEGTPVKGFYKSNEFVYIETYSADEVKKTGWVLHSGIHTIGITAPKISGK